MNQKSNTYTTKSWTIVFMLIAMWTPVMADDHPKLPTSEEIQSIIELCAGGRSYGFKASVAAALKKWREGVLKGSADASVETIGAVLSRIPTDASESKIYETYTKCVKDTIGQFLAPPSVKRLSYPLEDAEFTAKFQVNSSDPNVIKYVNWLNNEFASYFESHRCYDAKENELKIFYRFATDPPPAELICFPPSKVLIPAISKLFPDFDYTAACAEAFKSLLVILEFFEPGSRKAPYSAQANRGILIMKSEAETSTDPTDPNEKSPLHGLAVEVDLRSQDVSVIALSYRFSKEKWRRNPEITSILDLAGKELCIWIQLGHKMFFSEEVDKIRKSVILKSAFLRIGGLRLNLTALKTERDYFGYPVFVTSMPRTEEDLLRGYKQ